MKLATTNLICGEDLSSYNSKIDAYGNYAVMAALTIKIHSLLLHTKH